MPLSHRHAHPRRDLVDQVNPVDTQKPSAIKHQRDEKSENGGPHATLVKTIYKTLDPTFTGKVAGYTTLDKDGNPKPTEAPKGGNNAKDSSSVPSALTNSKKTSTSATVLAQATGEAKVSPSQDIGGGITSVPTHTTIGPTAQPSSSTSSSKDAETGTSAGVKAGIAFGVLGGLLLVGLLVFFLFNRRKKQSQERQKTEDENEKFRNGAAAESDPFQSTANRTDPRAPRISLRPVTQFLPNWNPDKRSSKGAGMSLTPGAAAGRPGTSQSSHAANPFGNQAERSTTPTNGMHRPLSPAAHMNATLPDVAHEDPFTATSSILPAGAAVGVAAGAGAMSRKTSMRRNGPNNLDLTLPRQPNGPMPASPAGTEFSMSSISPGHPPSPSHGADAIAASGGPANSAVHRVQLDFKPTLEDEMELRAGDIVRLLHEYDDGWALCIRLDRSQQGVVPRTCLSTRPVKPRAQAGPQGGPRPGPPVIPNGYARGPNYAPQGQRPMTPQGQRPMTPQGQRPMTPQGQRPMTPQGMPMNGRMGPGPRAQSPGPRHPAYPGDRPQSPNGMNRRLTPPGSSPMNPAQPVGRKPVPGQAL